MLDHSVSRRRGLDAQIEAATSVADLNDLWTRNEGHWAERHTVAAAARKAELTNQH